MREEVQCPLQSGETVLVLMEFRIPGKSSVDYIPTISIVDSENATLDCPYFESVGESILWDEYAADCAATSVTGLPLLEHSYCLGPVICEDDTDNKFILGIYMRVKAVSSKSPETLTLKGKVEGVEVTKSLSISDKSPHKLGLLFLKEDLSLRFAGPYEVEMYSRATLTLQLYFCLRPGTYFNNLSFEAFSEFTTLVSIFLLTYREQVSIRKAGGQIFARKVCAGPAYNTGYTYKKKNRLPNVTDDCIGIGVEFQLAGSEEVRSGAVHPVFTRIFDGDQLLHNLKVSVNVIDQISPNLNVDFHFTKVESKER
eukprot:TsM_000373500 transcript=TsM_000373500 gene=TsM_000373500